MKEGFGLDGSSHAGVVGVVGFIYFLGFILLFWRRLIYNIVIGNPFGGDLIVDCPLLLFGGNERFLMVKLERKSLKIWIIPFLVFISYGISIALSDFFYRKYFLIEGFDPTLDFLSCSLMTLGVVLFLWSGKWRFEKQLKKHIPKRTKIILIIFTLLMCVSFVCNLLLIIQGKY